MGRERGTALIAGKLEEKRLQADTEKTAPAEHWEARINVKSVGKTTSSMAAGRNIALIAAMRP